VPRAHAPAVLRSRASGEPPPADRTGEDCACGGTRTRSGQAPPACWVDQHDRFTGGPAERGSIIAGTFARSPLRGSSPCDFSDDGHGPTTMKRPTSSRHRPPLVRKRESRGSTPSLDKAGESPAGAVRLLGVSADRPLRRSLITNAQALGRRPAARHRRPLRRRSARPLPAGGKANAIVRESDGIRALQGPRGRDRHAGRGMKGSREMGRRAECPWSSGRGSSVSLPARLRGGCEWLSLAIFLPPCPAGGCWLRSRCRGR
jgi:hypothetical protein